ncbi:hypothetical protein SAHL_14210 [Salinisphaera orenii YIM 95161]|uniref:Uncharacterized protein n=1 Tax=Salinisphaera orenii YIM 95161 TaxID=1051139 RepID=A0A423PJ07_9GAMM|nr:hypothetical protein SAHL_14210 [Salinisphaera halophila YIM 95161]
MSYRQNGNEVTSRHEAIQGYIAGAASRDHQFANIGRIRAPDKRMVCQRFYCRSDEADRFRSRHRLTFEQKFGHALEIG